MIDISYEGIIMVKIYNIQLSMKWISISTESKCFCPPVEQEREEGEKKQQRACKLNALYIRHTKWEVKFKKEEEVEKLCSESEKEREREKMYNTYTLTYMIKS
jgi:hypothetical protein